MNLSNMNPRERLVLGGGAVVLVVLLVVFLGLPFLEDYELARRSLADARNRLGKAEALVRQLEASRADTEALEQMLRARGSGYNLYTSVDRAVRAAGLTERARLESQPMGDASGVRIALQGVSMEELVDFLYDVYTGDKLVVLYRLDHLEPAHDGRGLDCQVWLMTPRA